MAGSKVLETAWAWVSRSNFSFRGKETLPMAPSSLPRKMKFKRLTPIVLCSLRMLEEMHERQFAIARQTHTPLVDAGALLSARGRDAACQKHFAALDEMYFQERRRRLDGLQRWSRGRAALDRGKDSPLNQDAKCIQIAISFMLQTAIFIKNAL